MRRWVARRLTHGRVSLRVLCAICLICLIWGSACAPRLDEQQVRVRLLDQLHIRSDLLTIRSISAGDLPVAAIDYGGVEAQVRFRRQDGVWVVDAVGEGGRWDPADRAARAFGERLTEQARVRWLHEVMPRYARTLRLFVGWSELLDRACGPGLPASQGALLDLHAAWHRTLFPHRGTEFHNTDLFERDGWRRSLRASLSSTQVEVVSAGPDGKMDTSDDVRMTYARTPRGATVVCGARYAIPDFAADALGRADAPTAWNCADMLEAFRQGEMLDVMHAGAR
jgi:hypothetical protein